MSLSKIPIDLTALYRERDLTGEKVWTHSSKARYGAVVFDIESQVLLREPANHFDGFVWTFAKGGPDPHEHPVDTALRETFEETGYRPIIVGHLSEGFRGGTTLSVNYFYVAFNLDELVDRTAMENNAETWSVRWSTQKQAQALISQSTNLNGRDRDLRTLKAAYLAFGQLTA